MNEKVRTDEAYLQWAKDSLQIEYDKRLEIKVLDVDERGIFTKDEIPANTTLAKIPFSSLLSIYSAQSVPQLSQFINHSSVREDDLLSLLLLYHTSIGDASKWSPHIKFLPQSYHNIVNYTTEELEKIKGSNLYILSSHWKEQIRNDYQQLMEVIEEEIKNDFSLKDFIFVQMKLTFEKYLQALSCIWSRFVSVNYNGKWIKTMIPLIDFLNYSPSAKVGHSYEMKDGCFYAFTAETIRPDSEIFLNYGNLSNFRLLMLYGFTLWKNPFSSITIYASMDSIGNEGEKENLILRKLRNKILANHGIILDESSPIHQQFLLFSNDLPKNLMIFLRLQHITNEEIRTKFSFINQNIQTIISKENELKVLNNLKKVLQELQEGYNSPIQEDENSLVIVAQELQEEGNIGQGNSSVTWEEGTQSSEITLPSFIHPKHHHIHSLILTYSEKIIIRSAISTVEERISHL
jgi:hypothetical protein